MAKRPGDVTLTYEEAKMAFEAMARSMSMPPPAIELLGKLYRAVLVRADPEERAELARRINEIQTCMSCPACGRTLVRRDDCDAFRCPRCGGEWWPAEAAEESRASPLREIRELWHDEQRLKQRLAKKTGGGNRSGRKRRKTSKRRRLEAPTTE